MPGTAKISIGLLLGACLALKGNILFHKSSHAVSSSSVGGPRYIEVWLKKLTRFPSHNSTASQAGAAYRTVSYRDILEVSFLVATYSKGKPLWRTVVRNMSCLRAWNRTVVQAMFRQRGRKRAQKGQSSKAAPSETCAEPPRAVPRTVVGRLLGRKDATVGDALRSRLSS